CRMPRMAARCDPARSSASCETLHGWLKYGRSHLSSCPRCFWRAYRLARVSISFIGASLREFTDAPSTDDLDAVVPDVDNLAGEAVQDVVLVDFRRCIDRDGQQVLRHLLPPSWRCRWP